MSNIFLISIQGISESESANRRKFTRKHTEKIIVRYRKKQYNQDEWIQVFNAETDEELDMIRSEGLEQRRSRGICIKILEIKAMKMY